MAVASSAKGFQDRELPTLLRRQFLEEESVQRSKVDLSDLVL